jgi:hypothetical protein
MVTREIRDFLISLVTISYQYKFRNSNISCFLDIKPIFLKLWIFTNFNTILVFDVDEFSEVVFNGHRVAASYQPVVAGDLNCEVGIVGGGFSGLYMAYRLLKTKTETQVCIFEKDARVGGRVLDYRFEQAPDVHVGKVSPRTESQYSGCNKPVQQSLH